MGYYEELGRRMDVDLTNERSHVKLLEAELDRVKVDNENLRRRLEPRTRADLLLNLLCTQAEWRDPNLGRGRVTAMQHALQVGTRARRHTRGGDKQLIVAGLLHDAARSLTNERHGEAIAEIVRDRVRSEIYVALWTHSVYQAAILHDYPMPLDGPAEARLLAVWDAESFDPLYPADSLESFQPLVREVIDGV